MFREIVGLPLHALVVHAVVVFVPLLALLAVAYGVLPPCRSRVGWAVAALAVVTPVVTWVATEAGEELERVLREKGYPPQILDQVLEHADHGNNLLWFTVGLAVAAILLLLVTRAAGRLPWLPSWAAVPLTVVVVVLAAAALYFVVVTGDSGARIVWGGTL